MVRFFTAGESHGEGLVIIIEGIPAGLPITEDFIAVHRVPKELPVVGSYLDAMALVASSSITATGASWPVHILKESAPW